MLMIEPGTKNGEILRTPPSRYASFVCSIIGRPPMPEPMHTPTRSLSPAPGIEARVLHGFHRRDEAVVNEGVVAPRLLGRQIGADVEALDLGGDPASETTTRRSA